MKRPLYLPIPERSTPWLYGVLLVLIVSGSAWALLDPSDPAAKPLIAFLAAMYILVLGIAMRTWMRTHRQQAVLDEDGVGAAIDGHVTWLLPWRQLGGYRLTKQSFVDRWLHPELYGIEVLNTEGVVVGVLPVRAQGSYRAGAGPHQVRTNAYRSKVFFRELDSRVPEGGPKYEPAPPPTPSTSRSKVARQLVVGLVFFAVSIKAVMDLISMTSDGAHAGDPRMVWLSPWCILFTILSGSVGAIQLTQAWTGFRYLRNPKAFRRWRPVPTEEQRAYEEFLAEHGGRPDPPKMEEGMRYRYGHGKLRRPKLRAEFRTSVWASPISLAIGILVPILTITMASAPSNGKADAMPGAVLGAMYIVIFGGLGVVSVVSAVLTRQVLNSLDDIVVPHDRGFTVVKPDGSHLTFSENARRRRFGWLRTVLFGRYETWRENSKCYLVDLSHLEPLGPALPEDLDELERSVGA